MSEATHEKLDERPDDRRVLAALPRESQVAVDYALDHGATLRIDIRRPPWDFDLDEWDCEGWSCDVVLEFPDALERPRALEHLERAHFVPYWNEARERWSAWCPNVSVQNAEEPDASA